VDHQRTGSRHQSGDGGRNAALHDRAREDRDPGPDRACVEHEAERPPNGKEVLLLSRELLDGRDVDDE